MITLKREKGVYYVTLRADKLSTALKFIKKIIGKN